MQNRSTEETAFMRRGGYGLLKQFGQGKPFRKTTLERQFGTDLVGEAMQLHLIEVSPNPQDMSEAYFYITQRGTEVRDN